MLSSMQSPELVAEYERRIEKGATAVPYYANDDHHSRRLLRLAGRHVAHHQAHYDVHRQLRFGIADSKTTWLARALWPDGLDEDWIMFNAAFMKRCDAHANKVVRGLMRTDRAARAPGVEAAAGVARAERCAGTILVFFLSHEIAHHVFGHQTYFKGYSVSNAGMRALEFAADIHVFRAAAVHSLSFEDGDGGVTDPHGRFLAIRNSAAYVASILPLLGLMTNRETVANVQGGDHPFLGYRALLAHQVWANEVRRSIPSLGFDALDETFLRMLGHACLNALEDDRSVYLESLVARNGQRLGEANRPVQSVGYMSALFDAGAPAHVKALRAMHDQLVPKPNKYARGPAFAGHPYDMVD